MHSPSQSSLWKENVSPVIIGGGPGSCPDMHHRHKGSAPLGMSRVQNPDVSASFSSLFRLLESTICSSHAFASIFRNAPMVL